MLCRLNKTDWKGTCVGIVLGEEQAKSLHPTQSNRWTNHFTISYYNIHASSDYTSQSIGFKWICWIINVTVNDMSVQSDTSLKSDIINLKKKDKTHLM